MSKYCCRECQEYEQYRYRIKKNGKVKCYNEQCSHKRQGNICTHGDSKCENRKLSFNALDWYKKNF